MATDILNRDLARGTVREARDVHLEDQAVSGQFRVRHISRRRHFQLTLVWEHVTDREMKSVHAFWNANKGKEFKYVHPLDGRTYTGVMTESPKISFTAFNLSSVTIQMMAVQEALQDS